MAAQWCRSPICKPLAGVGLSFVLIILSLVLAMLVVYKSRQSADWVAHSEKERGCILAVLSSLQDAETGQRGYVMTGDQNYLAPYSRALVSISVTMGQLSDIVADNPVQVENVAKLRPLIDAKLQGLKQTIALRASHGLEASLEVVRSDHGRLLMDEMRAVMDHMLEVEEQSLAERQMEHVAYFRGLEITLVSTAIIVFLTGLWVMVKLRRSFRTTDRLRLEAEELSSIKSVFLSNMSHEIRTPMNGVIGAAELLLRSKNIEDKNEYGEVIISSAKSLMVIINDILDASKLESGEITLVPQPVSYRDVVSEAVDSVRAQVANKGLALELKFEEQGALGMNIDELRVRQVLLNLLSNAIKFTDRGSISVMVRLDRVGVQHHVITEIVDSGIGMDESTIERIFERFERGDQSITRKVGGVGLGVSISKSLIELMGGEVRATSRLGEGSSFMFRIPVDLHPEVKSQRESKGESERSYEKTALLVDDNVVNRKVGKKILESLGMETVLAKNGQEACEFLEVQVFDIIFMDIQMPVMDGVEATKQLKGRGCETPILAVTANSSPEEVETYLACGMKACLPKPINKSMVVKALDAYL